PRRRGSAAHGPRPPRSRPGRADLAARKALAWRIRTLRRGQANPLPCAASRLRSGVRGNAAAERGGRARRRHPRLQSRRSPRNWPSHPLARRPQNAAAIACVPGFALIAFTNRALRWAAAHRDLFLTRILRFNLLDAGAPCFQEAFVLRRVVLRHVDG